MNREMKAIMRKFFFATGVISCLLLLFCGCITASQRSAYNAYLTDYTVISMKSEGKGLKMEGLERDITFPLPEKAQVERLGKYLRFSPVASVVFFGESIAGLLEAFSD